MEQQNTTTDSGQRSGTSRAIPGSEPIDWVFEGLSPEPGWTWLDVECATGAAIERVRRRWEFACYYALSTREDFVKLGEQKFGGDRRIRLYARHGDSLLVVPSNCIDFGYGLGLPVEYTDEARLQKFLKEVARTLKPGAKFRFEVLRRDEPVSSEPANGALGARGFKGWLKRIGFGAREESKEGTASDSAPFQPISSPTPCRFSQASLREFVKGAGLSVSEVREVAECFAVTTVK